MKADTGISAVRSSGLLAYSKLGYTMLALFLALDPFVLAMQKSNHLYGSDALSIS